MKSIGWIFWVGGAALIFWVVMPVLLPVILAGILAIVVYPFNQKLPFKSDGLRALISTVSTSVLVVAPVSLFSALGIRALLEQLKENRGWENLTLTTLERNPFVVRVLRYVSRTFHTDTETLLEGVRESLQTVALKVAGGVGVWVGHLPRLLFSIGLLALSLFFLLKDGPDALRWLKRRSPFSDLETEDLFQSVSRLCKAIIVATLVAGLAQSLLFTIGALIVGVPQILLVAGGVFIASFVPVVGSFPVTLSLVAWQFFEGNYGNAIVLGAFAAAVSGVDNLVRPWLLNEGASLHPLLALLAVFGGIQAFGFAGVFLGPLLIGVVLLLLEKIDLRSA